MITTNETTFGKSEVPVNPAIFILDSTKIQSFQDCPRGFFFRHILGWENIEPSIHLIFGSAWHEAMEHLLQHGYSTKTILEAYNLLRDVYISEFPPEFRPAGTADGKNLETSIDALTQYCQQWLDDHDRYEILHTEIAGTVPIRLESEGAESDRIIHFKLDTLMRETKTGKLHSLEHKTGSRLTKSWQDKWYLLIQVWAYSHVLNMLAENGRDEVGEVIINGAILRKSSQEFLRLPIRKTTEQMRKGLWEINHWHDQIEWNLEKMVENSPEDPVMTCFPPNSMSCSKFGCQFPGLCSEWANPLRRQHITPPGYKRQYWDPRRKEEEANHVVHLKEKKDL